MRTRILSALLLLVFVSACEGADGKRSQPFAARAVCEVERWLARDDYRRREPGSNLCDADGIRVPRLPSPDEPTPDAEPAPDLNADKPS